MQRFQKRSSAFGPRGHGRGDEVRQVNQPASAGGAACAGAIATLQHAAATIDRDRERR